MSSEGWSRGGKQKARMLMKAADMPAALLSGGGGGEGKSFMLVPNTHHEITNWSVKNGPVVVIFLAQLNEVLAGFRGLEKKTLVMDEQQDAFQREIAYFGATQTPPEKKTPPPTPKKELTDIGRTGPT